MSGRPTRGVTRACTICVSPVAVSRRGCGSGRIAGTRSDSAVGCGRFVVRWGAPVRAKWSPHSCARGPSVRASSRSGYAGAGSRASNGKPSPSCSRPWNAWTRSPRRSAVGRRSSRILTVVRTVLGGGCASGGDARRARSSPPSDVPIRPRSTRRGSRSSAGVTPRKRSARQRQHASLGRSAGSAHWAR